MKCAQYYTRSTIVEYDASVMLKSIHYDSIVEIYNRRTLIRLVTQLILRNNNYKVHQYGLA